MKNTKNTASISDRFGKYLHEKGIPNEELFKCLNHLLDYSGCKPIRQFAEENNISVQSVYQNHITKTILGKKVVFDNL